MGAFRSLVIILFISLFFVGCSPLDLSLTVSRFKVIQPTKVNPEYVRVDFLLDDKESLNSEEIDGSSFQLEYSRNGKLWFPGEIKSYVSGVRFSEEQDLYDAVLWNVLGVSSGDYYVRLKTIDQDEFLVTDYRVHIEHVSPEDRMRHGKTVQE